MAVDPSFVMVLLASSAGLALSVVIERLMVPVPSWSRMVGAWGLHVGIWMAAFGILVLLLGRPWFAACAVSAFLLMLVLVNNAKYTALREAFIYQDYEYFTDAIFHPRLYIPFLGWGKFLGAAAGFVIAIGIGLWGEAVPAQRFSLSGQFGGLLLIAGVSSLLVIYSARQALPVKFEPNHDVVRLGLLASLWRYGEEECSVVGAASPFDALGTAPVAGELPHMIAVQSESFFDPRAVFPGVRSDVLAAFDQLRADSLARGRLKVPAWGANTVRTEFAFLSGVDGRNLGVHRFNPYRAVARGQAWPTLATFLKRLGYRTICIHPYPASFYRRDKALPRMGFDEFLDIQSFDGAPRSGPYVSDLAVAKKIESILSEAKGPLFVFVITMENHGPLHLESVESSDIQSLYTAPPPAGSDDLTVYLRHLKHADEMIGVLRKALEQCARPAGLCWYGDHVPNIQSVYDWLGVPDGDVEYVFWSNRKSRAVVEQDIEAHQLPDAWLRATKMFATL